MYSRAILLERVQLNLLRALGVVTALFVAVLAWHEVLKQQDVVPWTVYLAPSAFLAALVMVVMWRTTAIDPEAPIFGTWVSIIRGMAIVTVIAMAVSFFYREDSYSRGTFIVFAPLACIALYLAAVGHLALLSLINGSTVASRSVVVVGMTEYGRRITEALLRQPAYFAVLGFLDDDPEMVAPAGDITRLGSLDDFSTILDRYTFDVAMIAVPELGVARSQEMIGTCMRHGVEWKVLPPMLDLVLDRIDVEYVDGLPLVGERRSRLVGYNWYVKRSFDLAISLILLVVLAPVLAITWLLVRVSSPGPAIFRQPRVGLHGQQFTLLKFRTMRADTSVDQHKSATANWILGRTVGEGSDGSSTGTVHKIKRDQRVTGVGRFLRMTSIDELPQLWNVVRGDMSLVGPRPPIEYEVARYTERHRRRLDVPPGVTGLWQVSGRNRLSFDEMVELDIDYIEKWSISLDVEILLKTIPAVVSNHGY